MDTLNTSMQGLKENILASTDKLFAFKIWKKHLSSGNIEMFLLLFQIQNQSDYKEVIPLIISHLGSLTDSFVPYFLLCHQKCMTGLGTLLLGSHKIH
jgi:hypothetical protein